MNCATRNRLCFKRFALFSCASRSKEGPVPARTLPLVLEGPDIERRRYDAAIEQAVIAGWTGRDQAAVEKHIAELAVLGVKRPATTPIFYRVAASRLTTDDSIE